MRMVLGADRGAVPRRVLRDAATVLMGGTIVGLTAVAASGRFLEALPFEVHPRDPAMPGLTVPTVAGVTADSTHLPACAAARTDPAVGLRAE